MKITRRIAIIVAILLVVLTTVALARALDIARNVGQITKSNPLPVATRAYGPMYDAASTGPAPPVTNPANDFFRINGSATKTVYVHEMNCTITATTSANVSLYVAKRSTAGTGAVTVAATAVPRDSTSSAATAAVVVHADNAPYTPGTLVGNVWMGRIQMPAPATTGTAQAVPVTVRFDPPIALHGVAESLSWYLPAAAPAGGTCLSTVTFSEL